MKNNYKLFIIILFIVSSFTNGYYALSTTNPIGESFPSATDEFKLSGGKFVVKKETTTNLWDKLYDKYSNIILLVDGILAITFLMLLGISISKLNTSGDNPQERKKALMGILLSLSAITLLGAATLLLNFGAGIFG